MSNKSPETLLTFLFWGGSPWRKMRGYASMPNKSPRGFRSVPGSERGDACRHDRLCDILVALGNVAPEKAGGASPNAPTNAAALRALPAAFRRVVSYAEVS